MDDDRTRVIGAAPVGPAPEPAAATGGVNTLPKGTQIAEFEIAGLVGEGGFGIVYLAHDRSLGRPVALKEYMPSSLASRTATGEVGVKSERYRETFEAGLRSFVTEARILARFDHPSMVKVYRFWQERGTAYMVMPYYRGMTLKAALTERGAAPDEPWLRRMLHPILDALECLHDAQCLHRDIAPDNILLLDDDERPVLLDFGAARRVIGEVTQALTVILKPGYAPIEQYAEIPEMQQGPWTDVYALAAVAYYSISGKAPPPSVSRIVNDSLVRAVDIGRGRYSERFLQAIDAALAVRPADRTPSIAAFREAIGSDTGAAIGEPRARRSATSSGTAAPPDDAPPVPPPTVAAGGGPETPSLILPRAPAASVTTGATVDPGPRTTGNGSLAAAETVRSRWWVGAVGAVSAVAVAGGIGYGIYRYSSPAAPPPTAVQPEASVRFEAPTAATERPRIEPPAAEPPAPVPYTPLAVLDALHAARDTGRQVNADVPDRPVRINVDPISFRITSDRDGYLYLLMAGTDARHFYQIFPNALDGRNRIQAGRTMTLPRSSWQMVAGGPPGINEFIALVGSSPRDFARAGLKTGPVFGEFDDAAARRLWESITDPALRARAFAGTVDCTRDCDEGFGSVRFAVREVAR